MGSSLSKRKHSKKIRSDRSVYQESDISDEIKFYIEEKLSVIKGELENHKRTTEDAIVNLENILKNSKNSLEDFEEYKSLRRESLPGVEVRHVSSKISEQAVDDYIEEFLSKPEIQHGYISEAVEGVVYRRALKAMLHAIAHAANHSNFQLLGHRIVFGIEPILSEKGISASANFD